MSRPSLFIGSSSEALPVAQALSFQLSKDAEVTVWNEGVFRPGVGFLESLVNALDRFDFAVLVLTGDDLVTSHDVAATAPRDNLMFELGLFMGRLGRARTFALVPASGVKLPSDLAGVTLLDFDTARHDRNDVAAVGPAAFSIRQAIKDLGVTEARGYGRLNAAASEVENLSAHLFRLARLQARSRKLEISVFLKFFGPALSESDRRQMREDLEELEREIATDVTGV
jgi:hypothetical protein